MKLKCIKILIPLIYFFLFSCSTTKSVKIDFKEVSNEEIINKLKENNVLYEESDIASLKNLKTWVSYFSGKSVTTPHAIFFNAKGYKVSDKFTESQCSATLNNIENIDTFEVDENYTFKDQIKNFDFIEDKQDANNYDYYVIIYWALYEKNNHKTAFNWYNSAKNIKDKKVKVVLLNLDLNESWNITEQQKEILKLK